MEGRSRGGRVGVQNRVQGHKVGIRLGVGSRGGVKGRDGVQGHGWGARQSAGAVGERLLEGYKGPGKAYKVIVGVQGRWIQGMGRDRRKKDCEQEAKAYTEGD